MQQGRGRLGASLGFFTVALSFYNKDVSAIKKKVVQFTVEEQMDESEIEIVAGPGSLPNKRHARESTAAAILNDDAGMAPLEFSVVYLIQRQLPIFW